ncbi:MAG: cysteine desulfurase [Alphaproteobacteria bacterium]|nr:cysteine desulfurase [Alphaproteobacteria bacterium]
MHKNTQKIYLDYSASAPLRPEAFEAMLKILSLENAALNASSIHSYGQEGRKIIEQAREKVAAFMGCDCNQITFTSGATESNNAVIRHFLEKFPDDMILISNTEHPSILEFRKTYQTQVIPACVEDNGLMLPQTIDDICHDYGNISLVSVMLCNNESGILQDIPALAEVAHKHGALFHCDATQVSGCLPIEDLNADFVTISSHKLGGPQGAGALVTKICGQEPVALIGGGQEKGLRAGTENIAAIAGFGAACKASAEDAGRNETLRQWRDEMERRLKEISPDIIIHGENVKRCATTSFFSMPSLKAQNMLMALDVEGICISNGSACSSGTVKPSAVLKSMGYSDDIAASALRVSMGWATEKTDIDTFLEVWEKLVKRQSKKQE